VADEHFLGNLADSGGSVEVEGVIALYRHYVALAHLELYETLHGVVFDDIG
jgi:hypothetical protein